MTEKKISIWFSQDAWTGVWIMIAFGWALRSRSMAALPRWSEPLSTMTNMRGAPLYSGRVMTWATRSMYGRIPVVCGVEANPFPVWTSRPASSASAPWRTYSCSTRTIRPGAAGSGAWIRSRAWVGGPASDDRIRAPRAERLTLVKALVEVQDHVRLRREVRVAGEDPGLVPPRLHRVLRQDPQQRRHRHRLADQALRQQLGGQLRAGPAGQRHPGLSGQLAGQRHRRRPVRRADHPRTP